MQAWLPSQLSGQLSGGGSLTRDPGSLGSLGNLLKSNGDSMSRSSGGSESSQEDDKAKVDTDLAPGLHILRKRSYEHMGLDGELHGCNCRVALGTWPELAQQVLVPGILAHETFTNEAQ
jgi:hypothetical protein